MAARSEFCEGPNAHSSRSFYRKKIYAYETGKATLIDPMLQLCIDADFLENSIRACKDESEKLKVQSLSYTSAIFDIENVKILVAIFQAFSGQFDSDEGESVSDRNRAVAVCVQKFLLSKVTFNISFLKTNVNLL
jgi:hypothetical protein